MKKVRVIALIAAFATVYRQLHRDYLQKDQGIWRQIQGEDDLLFFTS